MTRLEGCCFCLSLKTGVILIGFLQAIVGISLLIQQSIEADYSDSYFAGKKNMTDSEVVDIMKHRNAHHGLSVTAAVIGAMQVFLSALLIYGAEKEKPQLLRPWIVFTVTLLVTEAFIMFGVMIVLALLDLTSLAIFLFLFILPSTIATYYYLLVVYSFYVQLVEIPKVIGI
ncbi:uncharacterized protein [Anabrus simplex]|uniref:uncharacterized protein n=1 Tax=Anabrus simplex TaxID=316456 RepID=UPI0035A2C70C